MERTKPPDKKAEFLRIAARLNARLQVTPLLYGSLGLEERLGRDLGADDVDVLIPEDFLGERWDDLVREMEDAGYALRDLHEHAFERDGLSVAFAALESLTPFAGVEIETIPAMEEGGARYLLLTLADYRRVYAASAKDGYRKDKKHKRDEEKIEWIDRAAARQDG